MRAKEDAGMAPLAWLIIGVSSGRGLELTNSCSVVATI
jgi:hypothetical protein